MWACHPPPWRRPGGSLPAASPRRSTGKAGIRCHPPGFVSVRQHSRGAVPVQFSVVMEDLPLLSFGAKQEGVKKGLQMATMTADPADMPAPGVEGTGAAPADKRIEA